MIYIELILGFLRVGLFSFGGAYGAIPLIKDVVLSYGWLTEDALTYMIAVSESTPGPIMVNLATYIGSHQGGLLGAILATLAVILPAFIIILLIMIVLKSLLKNKYIQAILSGLKPCVIGIILATGLYMIISHLLTNTKTVIINVPATIITLSLIVIVIYYKKIFKKNLSPIMLIVISACLGIIIYGI